MQEMVHCHPEEQIPAPWLHSQHSAALFPPCLRGFLAPHGQCGTKAPGQRQRDKAILAPQAQGWPSTAGTRLSPSQPCCEGVPRGGLPALQGEFGA